MESISNPPKISVVMPVYHADEFLEPSIRSIIKQSFSDFELIIICDDPSEKTRTILKFFENVDPRIKVYFGTGSGLINALNQGCQYAQGQYIARMDADDISDPERFEKQVIFLDNHPEVGVCGTWMEVIDRKGRIIKTRTPPSLPKVIYFALMFNNCIAHPTVIIRRNIFETVGGYQKSALYVEDYDLWTRLCCITQIASIPEFLVKYRYHGENISELDSQKYFEKKMTEVFKISSRLLHCTLGNQFDIELQTVFKKWKYGHQMSIEEIERMNNFILRISEVYQQINPLNIEERKELSYYYASLLLDLAFRLKNVSRLKAFEYFLRAIKIDPRLLIYLPEKIRYEILRNRINDS